MAISPVVLEKASQSLQVIIIYGRDSHLGHETWTPPPPNTHPTPSLKLYMKFNRNWPTFSEIKSFKMLMDIQSQWPWTKITEWPWPWPLTLIAVHISPISFHKPQLFWMNALFYIFPIQSLREQIWPCHKINQGQPKIIIYIIFVELNSLLLSITVSFKVIWLMVLEKRFLMIFTIYGHGCHLCHVTRINYINFCSPQAQMFYIKSDSNWGEDIWNFDGHSILLTVSQGHWMMTFDIHRGSYKTYFHFINYNCSLFYIFSIQTP